MFFKTELALPLLKGSLTMEDSARWLVCIAMWEFATTYKLFFPPFRTESNF